MPLKFRRVTMPYEQGEGVQKMLGVAKSRDFAVGFVENYASRREAKPAPAAEWLSSYRAPTAESLQP